MAETSSPSPAAPSLRTGRVLVFDSGVGGLTIVEELRALAPRLSLDYAADTGFFPYGDKSDDALRARLPEVARAIVEAAQPDVFVIACNTASTLALDAVRAVLDIPVVGTVPAVKPAAAISASGVIGLLATPGTIRRAYTDKLIVDFASQARVIKHGSLDLVRLAEAAAGGAPPALDDVAAAQAPLFQADGGAEIDTVVLACTHFPLIRRELQASAPREVAFIDSGPAIARQTLRVLPEAPRTDAAEPAGGRVFLTDPPERHHRLASVFARFGFPQAYQVRAPERSPGNATTSADAR